jgi:hypothetical protein
MIKVERITTDTLATIQRNGKPVRITLGTILTFEDLKTLKITKGELLYTVNEQDIVVVKATEPEPPVISDVKKVVVPDKTKAKRG